MKDNEKTWKEWLANNPRPEGATDFPWGAKTPEEQDLLLRWKAKYYNEILASGGYVATEATFGNPYILVWDGERKQYVSHEEGVKSREHMGIDQRAQEPSTTKATATGVSNPAPAPVFKTSLWQRVLAWLRRLFG